MEGTGYILLQDPPQEHKNTNQQYPPQQEVPTQQSYPPEGTKYVPPPPKQQSNKPTTKAAPVKQQKTSNRVVVKSQPTPVVTKRVVFNISDHYLKLSITATFIWLSFGNLISAFCTIPAIIFSLSAIHSHKRGDVKGAKFKGRVSLILNIVSIVWGLILLIIIIIAASVITTSGKSDNSYYSYDDYYYYYNYYYTYYSEYEKRSRF